MLAWHVPYLGWTRLPADVSDFEITHFFSLRTEERSAVLTRYRDSLRLGAALQIGFLKMCGRPLDAVQRVPAALLKHLGEQGGNCIDGGRPINKGVSEKAEGPTIAPWKSWNWS